MLGLLADNHIKEIRQDLLIKKASLKKLKLSYSAHAQVLNVDFLGLEKIEHEEEYYDNIEEHLIYANLLWLTPLNKKMNNKLQINFEAMIDVNPDGSLSHDNIDLSVKAVLFSRMKTKAEILRCVKSIFEDIMPFRDFIHEVEFKGHKENLAQIIFKLTLDGKTVNKILSTPHVINKQLLSQWLQTVDHIIDYNHGRYKFTNNVRMVNGRMLPSSFESTLSYRFQGVK